MFICTLLGAMDLDEAITYIYTTGSISQIDGDNYWVSEGDFATKGEAYGYVAYVTGLFLYVQAGWAIPYSGNQEKGIKSVEFVSGYWYDEEDDIDYMISIPMADVMAEFKTDISYEMDFLDLVEEIEEYVYYYGDESAF